MTPAVAAAVRASGVRSIAINNSWKLAPQADCLYAADTRWWRSPESPKPEEFLGERVHCTHAEHPITHAIAPDRVPSAEYVAPHPIANGSNSALQAAWREMALGARKIVLFGVDLRDDELTHWHGLHEHLMPNPTKAKFSRDRAAWLLFAAAPGRPEVINCSARSSLECFPKMTTEEALGRLS